MIPADRLVAALRQIGCGAFTGVPCSYLAGLFSALESDDRYLCACSEGEAVGIAAGLWLGGGAIPVVACQNSGLGNMVNPLTSLVWPYGIPIVLLISHRGAFGRKDEPQHQVMGRITYDLLRTLEIPTAELPPSENALVEWLEVAPNIAERRSALAFIVSRESLGEPLSCGSALTQMNGSTDGQVVCWSDGARPKREDVLREYLALDLRRPTVATTGFTARELAEVSSDSLHLGMVGSMGCAASIGLGVALSSGRGVTVFDGDGALLMKLGTLATIGRYGPRRLLHIVLDNGMFESTGGQGSNGLSVNFALLAVAAGYSAAWSCEGLAAFRSAVVASCAVDGPTFIHCRIVPGAREGLSRSSLHPRDLAARFREACRLRGNDAET